MSIKIAQYVNNIDYCWYDSSNVIYSECHDHENELKTLYVTFKNKGVTYKYENVNVNDYVLFKHDLSQGKAIHKLIKQYNGKPHEFKTVEEIEGLFNLLDMDDLLLEGSQENIDKLINYRKFLILLYNELRENNYKVLESDIEQTITFDGGFNSKIKIPMVNVDLTINFNATDGYIKVTSNYTDSMDSTLIKESLETDESISLKLNDVVKVLVMDEVNRLSNPKYVIGIDPASGESRIATVMIDKKDTIIEYETREENE